MYLIYIEKKELLTLYCIGMDITVKVLNFRTPKMFAVITLKFKQKTFFHREICPKGADGIANSVDPDQTVHRGAI